MWTVVSLLLLGYVPGAVLFRMPLAERNRRAALPAEERVFWAVVLSVGLSAFAGLGLAIGGRYSFMRVLWTDAGVALVALVVFRQRLRFGGAAPLPTWTALLPLALASTALWVNFLVPPAEYIMGGRDPGVYMTEGIRIAQRGGLLVSDEVVATVPPLYRNLFFPRTEQHGYYSTRFMGYFLLDPGTGVSVGQFPLGFPVLVALGYGVNGLNGARAIPGICGALGIVAVYFAGMRLFGRAAGLTAAALLGMHVAQLWYSRYPNAEIFLQPIVFAGLLSYTRSVRDGDGFFAPVSALLFVLGAFTHLTGSLVAAGMTVGAYVDSFARGNRVRLTFWIPVFAGTTVAAVYLWRFIPPYFDLPLNFIQDLGAARLAAMAVAATVVAVGLGQLRKVPAVPRDAWLATALVGVVWLLALYAYVFRTAGGSLTAYDADSLRTFTTYYLSPYMLVVALVGFAFAAFAVPHASVFLMLVAGFSVVFFYKIRIVPEHFWAARRFLAVILPGMLLLAGAAAFASPVAAPGRWLTRLDTHRMRLVRYAVGLVLLLLFAQRLLHATRPILRHVEYAGLIPRLEQLASTFGDEDLVIVESRNASDTHVLALPLAYVYARNVLVLSSPAPPKDEFRGFLSWALQRYKRVFFMGGGGGGTELLSRSVGVKAIIGERFQVPEYEPARNAYPRGPLQKEFDLSVYEFLPESGTSEDFSLDVGEADDLYVRRFFAKERTSSGVSVRWTRDVSFVSAVGLRASNRQVTLWMDSGGRPDAAPPATVGVSIGDRALGTVTVTSGMHPYQFAIPPDVADALSRRDDAAPLRLDTRTWNPSRIAGTDDRDLGVMVDRIEIR
jgi:hypothetical protein